MEREMQTSPELRAATEAALAGELGARDRLVEAWLPVVLRWCTRLGGANVDAEDAAQDILMVALRRLDSVYDVDRFPSWLFGITRRTLARHRRVAFLRRWIPGLDIDPPDPASGPARLYAVQQTGLQVQAILDSLPETEREVLVLGLLEGRSDREVAEMLDIPHGTVKGRIRRARSNFLMQAKSVGLANDFGGAP